MRRRFSRAVVGRWHERADEVKKHPNGRLRNRVIKWLLAVNVCNSDYKKNFKLRNNSVNIFIDDNLLMG